MVIIEIYPNSNINSCINRNKYLSSNYIANVIHPDLFGLILSDQYGSKEKIHYFSERDDDLIEIRSASLYYLKSDNWNNSEVIILDRVGEKILDLGSGAGRHSIYLQNKGKSVLAFDNSAGALEVCKKRGVKNTQLGSIFDLGKLDKKFDSILLFGHNLFLSGSPDNLLNILQIFHDITTVDGNVIFDYRSPIPTDNSIHQAYHKKNQGQGLPVGQLRFRLRYLDKNSDWIDFYLPTRDELIELLNISGWEITHELIEDSMHYLVINKSI